MREPPAQALLTLLQREGPLSAAQLRTRLGFSQPTLSRAVQVLGGAVERLGAARSTRYAARDAIVATETEWSLHRIRSDGRAATMGRLIALARGQFLVRADPAPAWLPEPVSLFPDLPWFLHDARPSGFAGRAFARRCAVELGLPADLARWSAVHTLIAWLARGEDLPGDFVVGDAAMARALRAQVTAPPSITLAQRPRHYADAADAAMAGELVGSSAGGEQPKFSACVQDGDGSPRHVLVKFTEGTQSPAKRRWCDLLIAEHHAAEAARDAGHAAARSELVVADQRLCLEVTRFDRIAPHGRRGVVSLQALTMQFDGELDRWSPSTRRLAALGWISDADAARVARLEWFGHLIANTDMHFGNLSFFLDDLRPLALAPLYDMLPMAYRPAGNGEIVPRVFAPDLPLPLEREAWHDGCAMALVLWQRVIDDARVSLPFREIARNNLAILQGLRERA